MMLKAEKYETKIHIFRFLSPLMLPCIITFSILINNGAMHVIFKNRKAKGTNDMHQLP